MYTEPSSGCYCNYVDSSLTASFTWNNGVPGSQVRSFNYKRSRRLLFFSTSCRWNCWFAQQVPHRAVNRLIMHTLFRQHFRETFTSLASFVRRKFQVAAPYQTGKTCQLCTWLHVNSTWNSAGVADQLAAKWRPDGHLIVQWTWSSEEDFDGDHLKFKRKFLVIDLVHFDLVTKRRRLKMRQRCHLHRTTMAQVCWHRTCCSFISINFHLYRATRLQRIKHQKMRWNVIWPRKNLVII